MTIKILGRFYQGDETPENNLEVILFLNYLHQKYQDFFYQSDIFYFCHDVGVSTVLVDSWLSKKFDLIVADFECYFSTLENDSDYFTTKELLDGIYYHYVFNATMDILGIQITKRQSEFRYCFNILRKQGYQMNLKFEAALLNKGVFLLSEIDKTKRYPYDLEKKFRITVK
ncbi:MULTISPECIES: hypothetical protein [unclassified Enterococcus]|uniref:hypothetical protein n=1 Tax=unclassified Enterococcus TaxID=2608891 RepID=UPI001554B444|nr:MULTISPECIES: hypothetical protein [unclassified Enterococcus]MBS7576966.1 hypothetical protein [Enterococcus sp. MMGLQ5-2]MBS7584373.1 hypothetical protein [Enterococcus sp. MMGLQ5-1]NPD12228.1 hypothetical protein [Enterococcus sp. MMGLQ5-1]NPD36800.1 hypothetical protein [Enterococcus sp. MMGLQ5-2]